ncbi:predicted protein [Nematostella vectensis]|uniref:Checkpoint protein n=1 Tax=Nematostella vectensis TaxID=45351 RepID=A7RGK3_NEMVE|nr:checkpoint protein HUS1 [Nematostella vectensis]EDO49542.1 predicted protein [Nematostella vectensis]|eukprot:XP_001641605.1 predicted protein [Nematostella vectensis]
MRFRAKIIDLSCMQRFTRVLGTISRMAKTATLRLTPTKLYFIFADTVASGGISIWCELNQCNIFDEYRIEGTDETNNIYLELIPENLSRAMRSASNAQAVKIKLTKKHVPCITFEIILPSLSAHTRTVTHDVPVSVIPQRNWDEYAEPNMPDVDVSIYMPPLKVLRNVVDRMKNLGNFLTISASYTGTMTLGVETDLVTVTTYFKHLDIPTWENDAPMSHNRDPDAMVEARVDIKKIATFLNGQQFGPNRVICNIVENRAVQFFLLHEDVSLQYMIPTVSR